MRALMAWNRALVNQLVPMQLSNPSTLGAALGVTTYIGCMHCVVPMPVQLVQGRIPNAALCTWVLDFRVPPPEMVMDIIGSDLNRALWNGTAKRIMVNPIFVYGIHKRSICMVPELLEVWKLFAAFNACDGEVICFSVLRAV
jgi:hypothetical protein